MVFKHVKHPVHSCTLQLFTVMSTLFIYPLQNLTNLRVLTLDGNGLETIPQLPGSLEELRINDNKINQVLSHNLEGWT